MEIEGYRDLVEVGEGGFAVVYRATQARLERRVALKVLKAKDLDERARRRFEIECEAMGDLSWHPNVVAVHDSGFTPDGRPYLVMEFLEHGSLADRVSRDGRMGWADAVDVAVQAAGALGAVHAAGRVHRDVKPANLLVGPWHTIKLADFGIAAVSDASHQSSKASFTAHYVAPEVLQGRRGDERGDLYSLAATVHALIAGRPPFATGENDPIATVLLRVVADDPPRLDGVPHDLADLIQAGMAKDPDARPQTALAFGTALRAVQAGAGLALTELRITPETTRADSPDAGPPPPVDPEGTIDVGGDPASPRLVDSEPPPQPPAPPPAPQPPTPQPAPPPTPTPTPPTPPPPAPPTPTPTTPTPPPPTPTPTPTPEPDLVEARPGRDRKLVFGGVAAVALIIVVVLAVRALTSGGAGSPEVVASIAVDPRAVAATEQAVWIVDDGETTVSRVDPSSNEVVATIDVGSPQSKSASNQASGSVRQEPSDPAGLPEVIAATEQSVWVANSLFADGYTFLSHIDPERNVVVNTIEIDAEPGGIAATDDRVWVTRPDLAEVQVFDAEQGRHLATIDVGDLPRGVAASDTDVWVANAGDDTVSQIDPATNEVVATIEVGNGPNAVAITEDAVWVADTLADSVTRIDPETHTIVATIEVGDAPSAIAAAGSAVWVANHFDATISRIDADTGEVTDTIDLEGAGGSSGTGQGKTAQVSTEDVSGGLAATETAVWVGEEGSLTRIDTGRG